MGSAGETGAPGRRGGSSSSVSRQNGAGGGNQRSASSPRARLLVHSFSVATLPTGTALGLQQWCVSKSGPHHPVRRFFPAQNVPRDPRPDVFNFLLDLIGHQEVSQLKVSSTDSGAASARPPAVPTSGRGASTLPFAQGTIWDPLRSLILSCCPHSQHSKPYRLCP